MTLSKLALSLTLAAVGAIHLVPVAGVLGAEALATLYGLPAGDTNLMILMRHRAVLFGLLGGLLLYAAFRPAYQALALIGGFVSVAAFLWISWQTGPHNAAIARIVRADLLALALLVVGAALWLRLQLAGND